MVAGFDANATYRTARKFANGDPYRPAKVHNLEQGTTLKPATLKPPSNNALLNFLERVITTPEMHNPKNVRQSAFAGAPVQSQKSRA